jgi:NTE family protein
VAPDPPRIAFVLGGGGRWGAVEVGMLRALLEAGVEPDLIVGTSIGAFNGAVFAADPTEAGIERLTEMWNEVQTSEVLRSNVLERAKVLARLKVAIHDPAELRAILERVLGGATFETLQVRFECVAASIERAAEHWFDTGDVIEPLLASAAIPGLFPPIEVDGEHFYDGGLVNSVPVDRAIDLGATDIYVLQVGRIEQPLRVPSRIHETALIAFEISRRHRFGSHRDREIPGVTMHVLPSANAVEFDDRRQIRWTDLGETSTLIDGAHRASAEYLAAERDGS